MPGAGLSPRSASSRRILCAVRIGRVPGGLTGAASSLTLFWCRFRGRTPGPPPFSSMNSTGNLVRRYAALFSEARRGPRVAPSFRLYSARSCAVGFANVDSFVAQQIALSHHPEADNCEVMIKRVGEPYSRTLHDDEAGCVDSGQFVEVGAPEIFP